MATDVIAVLAAMKCCIMCGESWSPQMQESYAAALATLRGAASVRAEAGTEGMEIIRAVAGMYLWRDTYPDGPDRPITGSPQCYGLTPDHVRTARAIVAAAERKEVLHAVPPTSAWAHRDLAPENNSEAPTLTASIATMDSAPPTAGPIPPAGAHNDALEKAAKLAAGHPTQGGAYRSWPWHCFVSRDGSPVVRFADALAAQIRSLRRPDAAPAREGVSLASIAHALFMADTGRQNSLRLREAGYYDSLARAVLALLEGK